MNLTLYELVDRHRSLLALGESDELPPEVIRDTLDGLDGELRDKARSVACFIRNLEAMANDIEGAAAAMLTRVERINARAQSIRDYLQFNLQAAGISRVECPEFVVQIKSNPPAVIVDNETQIPAQFKIQPPQPLPRVDLMAIGRALKDGDAVPGCHLVKRQRLEINP